MRSLVTPQAAADLRAAVRHHESEHSGLGRRFLADYRAARRFIETFPEAAPEVPGLASRRKLFGRFPFGLFYAVREDHLLILRVLHTSRHPDEWPRA